MLGRLTRALDRAGRAGALPRGLPLFLTEFGIQSTPDPIAGVSLAKQAEFQAMAERIAVRNPRVRTFSQYLLRDSDPVPNAPPLARYPGFESGLRFSDGRAKPALAAFPVPLSARRAGRTAVLWGLARPARRRTTVTLLYADRGQRFRKLRTVRTDSRGAFTTRTRYRTGRRWRLRWTSFTGPPIRAYR